MKKVLYFDCFSGISGDMTLGALLDAGVSSNDVIDQLGGLNLQGYRLEITKKQSHGISCTDVDVILEEKDPHHRSLDTILNIIETSSIPEEAKTLSTEIFKCIGHSEAKIHGKPINEIHFHEVGALDSIIDIVGSSICLSLLKPDIVYSSPLNLGSGTVTCAHGTFPVPAPATLDILKGVPVHSSGAEGERVTPTGAAIIKTIAKDFIPIPTIEIDSIGYGSGKKQFETPNLLRVFTGRLTETSDSSSEQLGLLETNIDDMNPEIYSYLMPLLFEKGALDAFLTNIIMKKGRPGVLLSVLCKTNQIGEFEELLFKETSTLGVRSTLVNRRFLERKCVEIDTRFGKVRVKIGYLNGTPLKQMPEYEDCRKIAHQTGIPINEIYREIQESLSKAF